MAKFGVCPLCGNHLEIHEESVDEWKNNALK
jgi:rRNA maturation endonuclease Nob1